MDGRQTLVSIFIVCVCLVKLAEAVLQIESFPFSRVSMFAAYRATDRIPWTFELEGWRNGRWVEVSPFLLGMRPGTFRARLGSGPSVLAMRCGELADLHNRNAPPSRRWVRVRARAHGRARPGSGAQDQHLVVQCSLDRRLLKAP